MDNEEHRELHPRSWGRIGFIGAGNMACAIIGSLVAEDQDVDIVASRRSSDALKDISIKYNVATTTDNRELIETSDIVIFCVKPQSLSHVIEGIADMDFSEKLVMSIIAGKKIDYFKENLSNCKKVVRAMPNLGVLVGKGAVAYAASGECGEMDIMKVNAILNTGSLAMRVSEEDIDTITALSGCGPAFISFFLKALEDAAVGQGLEKDVARSLLFQTLAGTYEYLRRNGDTYTDFITKVSSKGGATLAGLKTAEYYDIERSICEMVRAATDRSRELAEE
ncbi:MAG TPA: pyrroline-5-carboxylate reductase [Candidatus Methanofastidiosa archaeon]|nr:pyrroline-5-carboxylate reductase [Candidatus Methanofastidiosa archaeon]